MCHGLVRPAEQLPETVEAMLWDMNPINHTPSLAAAHS